MFLEMIQVTVWLHTDHLFLFGFTKTKTGAKTVPRAPKLSYFHGRAPQLSAWVYHGTPTAGVIGHIYVHFLNLSFSYSHISLGQCLSLFNV